MTCRSCRAEIADKAIVCYRCGTPTAVAAPARRAPPTRGGRGPAIGAGLVAIGAWLVVPGPMASPIRAAAAIGAGAVVMELMRMRGRRS